MNPNQPLTVVAFLPGSDHCIAQTSEGQYGRVDADHLRWTPITEKDFEAAVLKYGYEKLESRPSVRPEDLQELLASL